MTPKDVVLWGDSRTPSLAIANEGREVIWLDHADPNYGGKPMYQCRYAAKGKPATYAAFSSFEAAVAWFAWVDRQYAR
jgi:hypothetical protein